MDSLPSKVGIQFNLFAREEGPGFNLMSCNRGHHSRRPESAGSCHRRDALASTRLQPPRLLYEYAGVCEDEEVVACDRSVLGSSRGKVSAHVQHRGGFEVRVACRNHELHRYDSDTAKSTL